MLAPASLPSAFAARRSRFSQRFPGPALFVSGLARPRNFAGNRYPFRAESHFLYFVGRAIEGAALFIGHGRATLFAPQPTGPRFVEYLALPSLAGTSRDG